MQDDSGCCGGGGDGIATADVRGRDGLTLCLESACPVLGGASTVARRSVGLGAQRASPGTLCLCSTRLRGAQRNCGHLWAFAIIQYRQTPSLPSISTTCFCTLCLEGPIIPSCVVLDVPLRQTALHKHSSAYGILPGSSW